MPVITPASYEVTSSDIVEVSGGSTVPQPAAGVQKIHGVLGGASIKAF